MDRAIVTVTKTLVMFNAKATPTPTTTTQLPPMLRVPIGKSSGGQEPSRVMEGEMEDMGGPPGPWNTTDPFPDDFLPTILTPGQMAPIEWTLVAVTFILLCIRIYFRVYMTKRIKWSDIFAIMGWTSFCIWASMETAFLVNRMNGPEFFTLSPEAKLAGIKMDFVEPLFYFATVYSIKGAMLCFYSEMLARTTKTRLRIVLRVIGGCCVLGFIYTNFYNFFACLPLAARFSLDPNFQCKPASEKVDRALIFVQFFSHLLTDIAIYVFPIFILKGMVLPLRKKIDAGVMFAIGFLTLANAAIYFALLMNYNMDPAIVTFASMWEMAFAVTLACAPSLKVFWITKVGPQIRSLTGNLSSFSLTSKVGHKRKGSGDELNALEKQENNGRHLRVHKKRHLSVSQIRLVTLEEHAIAMKTHNGGEN